MFSSVVGMRYLVSTTLLTVAVALSGAALQEEVTVKPKLFRILVPVSDIDRTAQFYETVLAMEGMRVSPGRHYFDLDGAILALYDPRADGDGYDATPNPEDIYIAVDDLEATYAACQSAGANFAKGTMDGGGAFGEIATRPWGERSFYLTDPSGNKLCFVDRATIFTGPPD